MSRQLGQLGVDRHRGVVAWSAPVVVKDAMSKDPTALVDQKYLSPCWRSKT